MPFIRQTGHMLFQKEKVGQAGSAGKAAMLVWIKKVVFLLETKGRPFEEFYIKQKVSSVDGSWVPTVAIKLEWTRG